MICKNQNIKSNITVRYSPIISIENRNSEVALKIYSKDVQYFILLLMNGY